MKKSAVIVRPLDSNSDSIPVSVTVTSNTSASMCLTLSLVTTFLKYCPTLWPSK